MILRTLVLGPFVNNVYILADPESREGVIIDAGFEPGKIVEAVREEGIRAREILLTHGHIDHVIGVDTVRDALNAVVRIHPEDRWLYDNVDEQASLFGLGARRLRPPDGDLSEGQVIRFGRYELRAIHTPGHTPGSTCLYLEHDGEHRVFTGDTLFAGSIGRTDLWGGDLEGELRSIRNRLFRLPDDTRVLPGHGPDSTILRERLSNPFLMTIA